MTRSRDALGGLVTVAVAVLFAATLVAARLSGAESPFWLGAWMRVGVSLVAGSTVLLFWRRLRLNRRLVLALLRRSVSWETPLVMFSYLDLVFSALSLFWLFGVLGELYHVMLWVGVALVVLGNGVVVLRGYVDPAAVLAWSRLATSRVKLART